MTKYTATTQRKDFDFLGMRWIDRDCLIPALFALVLFLGVAPKASATEITITNASGTIISSSQNNNAWTSTNGPTNTMTWPNTTTSWTNFFGAPGASTPYLNGIKWVSSGTLTLSGTPLNSVAILSGSNPTINVTQASGTNSLANSIFNGSSGLTKTGLGTLNFGPTSTNGFTGGLWIDAGKVNFSAAINVPTSNDLYLRGGTLNFGALLNLTFMNVTWGNGTLTSAVGSSGSSLTAASYTITNSVDITNGFVLAGVGGLNKSSGEGNFVLSAANTFGGAGVTNKVSAGTLTLGNASALGSTSNSFELRGGTLALGTYNPTFATFTFAGGNLSGTTNTLTANTGFVVTGGTTTISNPLAGSGGFTQNGSGTTTLQKANYSGTTTVSQGVLVTTGSNWTATVSPSTISMVFTGTVAPGNYKIYPGSFTGSQTLLVPTGLSTGQTATWIAGASTVQVQAPAGNPTVDAGQIFFLPLSSATSGAVVGTLTGQSTGTWAIVSGNDGVFSIDSTTGTLSLAQPILTTSSYTLGVTTSTSEPVSVLVNLVPSAQAGVQYFDGNGVWSTTEGTDWTATAGASSEAKAWVNSNNAVFWTNSIVTGGSGTNQVSSITVLDGVTANVAAGAAIRGVSSNTGVVTINIGTNANYVTAQANDWSVGYIKNGVGSLVMSNTTSTYSGGFTLNAGSVRAANYNALGAGNVIVNGGALAASGTSGVNLSFSNLVIQGNFTLGDSSYGTLNFQTSSNTASLVGAPTINLAGTNNSSWGFNAPISGTGASLTLIGTNPALTNTVQFNSANSFGGGLNIKDMKVLAGANGSLGTGVFTFKSGSSATTQLALNGKTNTVAGLNSESAADTAVSLTSFPNGELAINSPAGTTNSFYGGISGTGTFTLRKSGEGTQWLNKGTNGIAGGVILEAGNLGYGADKAFGTIPMTISGGRILTKTGITQFANAIAANGDFGVDMCGSYFIMTTNSSMNLGGGSPRVITRYGSPDGDLKIMGTISNGGLSLQSSPSTIAANGTSQFWLTGTNTYNGGTIIGSNTTVKVYADSSLGAQPSSRMANFVVLSTASGLNTDTANNIFNFDANSGFQLGSASDPTAFMDGADWTSTFAPKISVSTNAIMTIQGVISDISGQAGDLQKDGSGKLILTGANTYTGNTFVANGTLEGNAASVRGNILIGTTNTNNLNYTNTTALILNQASDATFGGFIAGQGTLEKNGAGVLTLTGSLTYTNTTKVSGGSLVVTNAIRVATITTNTVEVSGLTSTVAGTYDLLPGPLANLGTYNTPSVSGLATNQTVMLTNSPNLKLVVQGKIDPTVIWPTVASIIYGDALSAATLTSGTSSVAGAFAFITPGYVPNAGLAQNFAVTFTPTDAANYNTLTQDVAVTVNKANATVTWPTASSITYDQALSSSNLLGGSAKGVSGADVAGMFAWTDSTTPRSSTASYEVTFTPTGADAANYNTLTQNVAVTVNPAGTTYTGWLNSAPGSNAAFLEYVFGAATAGTLDASLKPTVSMTGGNLVLTYYVRQGTLGLTVTAESSSNLSAGEVGWSVVADVPGSSWIVNGVSVQQRTASVPVSGGKKFLRVKAVQN